MAVEIYDVYFLNDKKQRCVMGSCTDKEAAKKYKEHLEVLGFQDKYYLGTSEIAETLEEMHEL